MEARAFDGDFVWVLRNHYLRVLFGLFGFGLYWRTNDDEVDDREYY